MYETLFSFMLDVLKINRWFSIIIIKKHSLEVYIGKWLPKLA